jgi:WXXGXW repeat (2 copies)
VLLRTGMKHLLLSSLLLLAGTAFAQISVGIRIGPPPPPRVVRVRPVAPGPDYAWVDGYWYPVNNRYVWHQGYWTRSPYVGAHWIAPRHEGGQWFEGYWEGERGRIRHEHGWDRNKHERDWRHDRDHDHR